MAVTSLSLGCRSPLVFPAGRATGFDPTHPAIRGFSNTGTSNGIGWSAVWVGSNFVNVLSGASAVKNSTGLPTPLVDGLLGRCGIATAATQIVNIASQNTATKNAATAAAILRFTGTGDGSFCTVAGFDNTSNFAQWGMVSSSKKLFFYNGGENDSTFAISLNVPYFIAMSFDGASFRLQFVATNLNNGQVFTSATTTAAAGVFANSAAPTVGGDITNTHYANASIAAAMFSPFFISMEVMRQWAAEPWNFWYPNKSTRLDSVQPTVTPPSISFPSIIGARKPARAPRLEFPAGRAPGIDLTNSTSLLFSAVPAGVNSVNLLNGKLGSPTSINSKILGYFGPSFGNSGNTGRITFSGYPTTFQNFTVSAIFCYNSAGAGNLNFVLGTSSGNSGWLFGTGVQTVSTGNLCLLQYGGMVATSTFPALTAGVPYFAWASCVNTSGTNYTVYFVLTNLLTGKINSCTVTGAGTQTAGDGVFQILQGATGAGFNLNGDCAAVAFENISQPLSVGLRRATDPWSFWYPNKDARIEIVPGLIAVPFIGSYLTLGNSNDFLFSTGDFTIDFWLNIPTFGPGNQQLINSGNSADWYFYVSAAGGLRWKNNTGDCCDIAISTGVHHLAVTRASGTTRVFVDGIKSAEFADTSNYGLGSDGPWVGRSP